MKQNLILVKVRIKRYVGMIKSLLHTILEIFLFFILLCIKRVKQNNHLFFMFKDKRFYLFKNGKLIVIQIYFFQDGTETQ
jgi:hypothetical protein